MLALVVVPAGQRRVLMKRVIKAAADSCSSSSLDENDEIGDKLSPMLKKTFTLNSSSDDLVAP